MITARRLCQILGLLTLATFIFFAVAGTVAHRAYGEDMKTRAQTALGSANTGGALFTDERKDGTASAFQADDPPQADVHAGNIESKALSAVNSDSRSGLTHRQVQTRPRLTLEPSDSRLDPGKWASTTGATLMGDLKSGSKRSCTYNDFGSAPAFQRTCDRYQKIEEPKCAVPLVLASDPLQPDTKDTTACLAYDTQPLCQPTGLICTSGAETRIIDGVEVTKLCWEWEQSYICHAEGQESNCTPYETNQSCRQLQSDCLATNANGECSHESALFECGNPDVKANRNCSAIKVCEGTLCDGIPPDPDDDFTQAAAWLNVANEAAKDNNLLDASCDFGVVDAQGQCAGGEEVRFFGGRRMTCGKLALGIKNCCRNSGIIVSLFDNCSNDELEIQQGLALKKTRYLGEFCSKKVLGFCVKRKLAFCNFETKFARVFQEEAKRKTDMEWAGANAETCLGLSHSDVAGLDMEQIDLSELFGDLLEEANISDPAEVNQRLLANMAAFGGSTPPDVNTPPATDPNFSATEITATANPDYVPETTTTTTVFVPGTSDCEGDCNDGDKGTFVTTTTTTPEIGDPFLFEDEPLPTPPSDTYTTAAETDVDRPTLPAILPVNPNPNPDAVDPTPSPINADQTGDSQ